MRKSQERSNERLHRTPQHPVLIPWNGKSSVAGTSVVWAVGNRSPKVAIDHVVGQISRLGRPLTPANMIRFPGGHFAGRSVLYTLESLLYYTKHLNTFVFQLSFLCLYNNSLVFHLIN